MNTTRASSVSAGKEDRGAKQEVIRAIKASGAIKTTKGSLLDRIELAECSKDRINAMVVKVPYQSLVEIRKEFAGVLSSLEELFPSHTVFLVRQKAPSGLKAGERRRRTGPTRIDYQESAVRDLIFPGHVVDRRTSVRTDGVRLEKIFIDRKSEQELSNRLDPMAVAFESLFKKQASFQVNYY